MCPGEGRIGLRVILALFALLFWATGAAAADPVEEFKRGTKIFSLQVGGGVQNNVEGHRTISDISFVNLVPRFSVLPLDPIGSGFLRGAVETGLEPWLQYYLEPRTATAEGLKVALRYHFLSAAPIFPYVEVLAGMGGTSLNVKEVRSDFAIVMEAGVGLGYFLADGVQLTAGYRFQHISNGNIESPNRGFNSDAGILGVGFFFH
ncbi:MAG: acyloxyacyl hydrolase [Candidatus Rokubacteria bacterium]|nr:acyloxyacyl hydrolase [Candidatus Rokubacteria bacterium]